MTVAESKQARETINTLQVVLDEGLTQIKAIPEDARTARKSAVIQSVLFNTALAFSKAKRFPGHGGYYPCIEVERSGEVAIVLTGGGSLMQLPASRYPENPGENCAQAKKVSDKMYAEKGAKALETLKDKVFPQK